MPRARNGDVSLYYEVREPEAAGERAEADDAPETVAFVEGLGYGRWMWRFQSERLPGYRRIVWDNRGTGDSDLGDPSGGYTIGEMAADLEAVLSEAGVETCHLVGASMGGMVVQEYAIEYDRAETLTLLCTSPGGDAAVPTPEETVERMYASPEGYDERELIRHRMTPAMTEEFRAANEELIERIVDWRTEGDASEAGRNAQGAAVEAFDATGRLDRIEAPALVAHGTDDRVLPVENGKRLAERLPDAELELFEGGSHLFFIEEADRVTDRIREFLSSATTRGDGGEGEDRRGGDGSEDGGEDRR